MLIVACISGHGFGHLSRTASILTALHGLQPDWRLVLSTPLPLVALRGSFGPVPFEHRPCRWDVGVVQADALGADAGATLAALAALEIELPSQISREAAWLAGQGEPILVVGDVPPAAAALAQALGAPLIWVGNFGWDAIYRPMGGAFVAWADRARQAYGQGQAVIECPFAMAMDWAIPHWPVGLTAGVPRLDGASLRQLLAIDTPSERTVLVGFGGMGFPLPAELFGLWPEHHFLVTEPALAAAAANATLLPPGLRPLDVMPVCGRVLTKPGYSTFCEALSQGLGVHLVRREGFAEAPVLEAALQAHGRHRLLSRDQLLAGDWQLDQPLHPAGAAPLPTHGANQAAQLLDQFIQQIIRQNCCGTRT
jgi:hypothetical protein